MLRPTCIALLALGIFTSLRAAEPPELITHDEVLRSLQAHAADWQAKIRTTSPRLYFSDQQWPKIVAQIDALSTPRASLRDAFYAEMDATVAEPLPVYLPPEQMVGKRGDATTLYSAMEELWQRDVGNQIFALAVAARLKPQAPYLAKMHDLVMDAVNFPTWGRNKPPMGDNSDLAAGHIGRGIAVAYDWHRDAFTPAEREHIRTVVAARLPCLLKGLYGDAFWAGGFQENHNQVSVSALGFCGIAFYDEIPGAPEWLAAARLDFQQVGLHAAADGSSVEGVSYWTYGMNFILQYIEGTRLITDSADLYQQPFLKNAAAFRLMAATSDLNGTIPWGDAVPRGWSTPHAIIYRLASEYQDASAGWFADHLPAPRGGADDRALNLLWSLDAPASVATAASPAALDGRLTANDLVDTRSGWSADDYLLSFKGGFTNRNHSHLDAGALALAFGDDWVLVAPGYGRRAGEGAYWQSGGPRWNYFATSTESHSTLLVDGKNQRFDHDARATITRYFSAPQWNWTTMDLTRAYHDVDAMSRSILHRRGDYILVFDQASAAKPVTVEWLAQFHATPATQADGSLLAKGKKGRLQLTMLAPATGFYLRKPHSPKMDVKAGAYFTYAAKQTGQDVRFTALLQPVSSAHRVPPLTTRFDGGQLAITGQGWTDYLAKADKPSALQLALPAGEGSAPVHITGSLAVIRTTPAGIDSFIALEATSVELPGFSYHADSSCDLAAQKTATGWTVTASRDLRSAITLPPGQSLQLAVAPSAAP